MANTDRTFAPFSCRDFVSYRHPDRTAHLLSMPLTEPNSLEFKFGRCARRRRTAAARPRALPRTGSVLASPVRQCRQLTQSPNNRDGLRARPTEPAPSNITERQVPVPGCQTPARQPPPGAEESVCRRQGAGGRQDVTQPNRLGTPAAAELSPGYAVCSSEEPRQRAAMAAAPAVPRTGPSLAFTPLFGKLLPPTHPAGRGRR